MDYTKLTIAEIANGISKTEAAIRRCREILDDLQDPKTVGMQAVVKAIRDLLPKLEEDLKSLHPRHQAQALGRADLIALGATGPLTRDMSPSTITIRFDPERAIGERWVILETNEQGLVVIRGSFRTQIEAERALTTVVPLGKKIPESPP